MNWDAIGAIGEVAGAVGVIITLLYLSIQIRQNSKMMQANSKQSIADASQQLIYHTKDEAEIMEKFIFTEGELTPIEHRKAWFLMRAMLRGYESQVFQYELGLMDESEWNYLKNVILETTGETGVEAAYFTALVVQ